MRFISMKSHLRGTEFEKMSTKILVATIWVVWKTERIFMSDLFGIRQAVLILRFSN